MIKLSISENEDNQRLDRFLKKYFKSAPLSYIYKLIRKDVKVNGKRGQPETILLKGDELTIYMEESEAESFSGPKEHAKAKRQFNIAYEDENILVAEKPFGLLVHGDKSEKKNTLANQVISYLIETGSYVPRAERTFCPSPVNRLDRNTTGLVLFGKNNKALQGLNYMIRERNYIKKYYLTIVSGELDHELCLTDKMQKDRDQNKVTVFPMEANTEGLVMETIARPLVTQNGYTLLEVELLTGRTHQIRAHLQMAGYCIIGDEKYGNPGVNRKIQREFGLSTQFLHAYKLVFEEATEALSYLKGTVIKAPLPQYMEDIQRDLFGGTLNL